MVRALAGLAVAVMAPGALDVMSVVDRGETARRDVP